MHWHSDKQVAGAHRSSSHEQQRLFEQLDLLLGALRDPAELERELQVFESQVRAHFDGEERDLDEQGYPGLRQHRQEHAAYARELERARRDGVGPAGIAFLRAWLVNHAAGDRQHQEWLAQRRGSAEVRLRGDPTPARVIVEGGGGREPPSR